MVSARRITCPSCRPKQPWACLHGCNAGKEAAELTNVEPHEPGGVLPATNAEHTPTKRTAGFELAGAAEAATTTKPEALESWVGGDAGHGHRRYTAPREGSTEGKRVLTTVLPQGDIERKPKPDGPPR